MRRGAPILWYGLIFLTSCTVIHREAFVAGVGSALPTASRSGWADLWEEAWWLPVKGWHATEFALLFLLVRRAVRDVGWSLFLVALAAILDEFHQTFVPGRGGLVSDVLIDVGGALAAAVLLSLRSGLKQAPLPTEAT